MKILYNKDCLCNKLHSFLTINDVYYDKLSYTECQNYLMELLNDKKIKKSFWIKQIAKMFDIYDSFNLGNIKQRISIILTDIVLEYGIRISNIYCDDCGITKEIWEYNL